MQYASTLHEARDSGEEHVMAQEIKQQIADYLAERRYMALATVGADGKPVVHTVGYASEGTTVYCATSKQSRKAQNIQQNPNVAFVVDEDYHDLESIKGIQMQGQAHILADLGEIQRVVGLIMKKFPQFANTGPNPDVVFFQVKPSNGFFIDYSKGFGHRAGVTF
jgi:nitroimidazol reductase NimA-like FMN-containing flavoprotein (pyridoxamine 5'-phosphate oxidase superfamily)